MEHARIIRLEDNIGTSDAPRIATFEEAFGEYSELFGKKARARRETRRDERSKGKVRRQERKTDRKVARQTRKDDVRGAKQQRRSNRKERRQQLRIDRRAQRKGSRQNMRAEQQAARMARRMERKRQRQDRKDETADREMERELRMAQGQQELDSYAPQDDGGYDDGGYDDGGYDDGGYDDGGYDDGGYNDGGYDDGGYDDGGSYGGGSYGGGSYYEEDYGDDGYGDESDFGWNDPYDDYGYDDYNYEDDYGFEDDDFGYDDGYNFDGETGVEEDDSELSEAQKLADKIEWNKKLISKMSQNGDSAKAINERNDRISTLKCQMSDFVSFDGDYFDDYEEEEYLGADGKRRKKSMKGGILRRMKKAQTAKGRAKRKAYEYIPAVALGKGMKRGFENRRNRRTRVQGGIGAEIENNRIVIPATSGLDGYYEASGTGVTALDANSDYGYSPTEIQLGFDGKKNMGMSLGVQVAVGLGVGIAVITILKSTKVI